MRIRVLGPGAVGGLLGGMLAHQGMDVEFAGPGQALERLRREGLRLLLPGGFLRIREVPTARKAPADLLLVALQRHQLKTLRAGELEGQVAPEGLCLFLNAEAGALARLAPPGRACSLALTLMRAVRLQPGTVELAAPGPVLILPKHRSLRGIARVFRENGFSIVETEEVEAFADSFFLWQLLGLPAALCHATQDLLLAYPEGQKLAENVLREGIETFRRKKRKLRRLPLWDPQDLLRRIKRRSAELASLRYQPDRGYGTLLQSLLQGKSGETKELNGSLVNMASEVGFDAAWNWRLTQKLSRISQLGFFPNPAELYQAVR